MFKDNPELLLSQETVAIVDSLARKATAWCDIRNGNLFVGESNGLPVYTIEHSDPEDIQNNIPPKTHILISRFPASVSVSHFKAGDKLAAPMESVLVLSSNKPPVLNVHLYDNPEGRPNSGSISVPLYILRRFDKLLQNPPKH